MPTIYDQDELGSCTANSIARALQFDEIKQGEVAAITAVPSRLFIYYNERVIEGSPNDDSGAELRDGAKTVATDGWCAETTWPYNITAFATKPPQVAYDEAKNHKALVYYSINQNINLMKQCLSEGYPFVFGFTVYDSFENDQVAQSGILPMPGTLENVLGGHAVCAVGYDDSMSALGQVGYFIIANSWGPLWGDKGYFYMPYNYVGNPSLASDFWTFRKVS
jgi:C1A family cysteine protease